LTLIVQGILKGFQVFPCHAFWIREFSGTFESSLNKSHAQRLILYQADYCFGDLHRDTWIKEERGITHYLR
jgi:hypothetical protein